MELQKELDLMAAEAQAREHLGGVDLAGIISGQGREKIRFVEGPPTMNGTPHAGHLRGRILKDLWYRYETLRGKNVAFNAGWDTQGLPVELQAEKELGVTGGKAEAVRTVGVERLVAECKRLVKKYNEQWVRADRMLGISLDQEGAYWTYRDGFIEREWQVLRRAMEGGILEEDHTVIAYCPSCQTSLSHAEVNQGYEETRDPSLYYKARLEGEDAFLIVWTTMPFTLVTDAMVGLNPSETYNYVRVGSETWVVGASRTEEFFKEAKIDDYEVVRTAPGSDFEGKRYEHPLAGSIPALKEWRDDQGYYTAVAEEFVDTGTGSGLVHLSPANGEEDIGIARRRGMKVFCPIDDQVRFTGEAGRYAGMFVRDADKPVVEDLKERGALVRIGRIRHKYPMCWRSGHPIVWLARRGWFYRLEKLGDRAVRAAEGVEYFYEAPRNRFLGIVGERHPWCISRERVWGCPLPVWDCSGCGAKTWLFSRADIVKNAAELPDGEDFELHMPWIDRVKVRCPQCGGTDTAREQYVLDTWHNSGSAPWSSLTDEQYAEGVPAPFFTEGIDQTRGWAYTLLIENVILGGQAPYRSFLFQGHVLDEKGNKMSKSRGNVIDAEKLLAEHPADLVRLYFVWKSSPIEPLSFDREEMMARPRKILNTLYHMHVFYSQNSSYDGFDGRTGAAEAAASGALAQPDVWLLSRLQGLVAEVTELTGRCRYHEAARKIEEYVIDSLSTAYIPIVRAELWDEDESKKPRRLAIYAVLREVLLTLDVLLHPVCPHMTEYLYQCVFGGRESILLEAWPEPKAQLEDRGAEESFGLMSTCVSVCSAARMKAGLKRRWPLQSATVCVGPGGKRLLERAGSLLGEQLNVEKYDIVEVSGQDGLERVLEMKGAGLPVRPEMSLERGSVGPKAREHMPALAKEFEGTDPWEIASSLKDGPHRFGAGGIALDREDFVIEVGADEGHAASSRGPVTVIISTERSAELEARGLLKDVARRLQTLRKERGYQPTDVLESACVAGLDGPMRAMLEERADELAFLVRVRSVRFDDEGMECKDEEVDGARIRIGIRQGL